MATEAEECIIQKQKTESDQLCQMLWRDKVR